MLNYCKMFNIVWEIDDISKKVKLIQRKNYFSNYTIEDWTDKLDMSKDFIINPLMADKHYLLCNYKDIKTDISENYNKAIGFNIGEKEIDTTYVFNEDTKDLFSDLKNSNAYSPNRLEYLKLFDGQISYYGTSAVFIDNVDKDGNDVENFGSFYLRCPQKSIVSGSGSFIVTDDNVYQKSNRKPTFGGNVGSQIGSAYPAKYNISNYFPLSIIRRYNSSNNICLFNKPLKSYIFGEDFSNANTIYDLTWKNFIQERYHIQNKTLTCYLRL